jgi:diaminopimelate epimerase
MKKKIPIPFMKMQGAGNDFIVIDNRVAGLTPEELAAAARRLCLRRTSIGADALMALDEARGDADFRMIFYNADGTEAEMCGNGARCIARYAYEKEVAGGDMTIETVAGTVRAQRITERSYRVALPDQATLTGPHTLEVGAVASLMEAGSGDVGALEYRYVELGDPGIPHAVVVLADLDEPDVWTAERLTALGRFIRNSDVFPKGANVNFCKVLAPDEILLRTYERGVEGITDACGTGAGSTALALRATGLLAADDVKVRVPGGTLEIGITKDAAGRHLTLTGDTNIVAEGTVLDEDLQL